MCLRQNCKLSERQQHIWIKLRHGQRDRIALIQVGDEQVLVGLTPGRIEKLHTLKSALKTDVKEVDNQSFGDKFNQLLNRDNQSSKRVNSNVD